ncbi:hypothetical protein MED01_002429 [Micromonospora sp. MED01]|uniref:hypothetical protein n=1 Tax=Micromonospora alfalfae TaxID=2911212 RepID=UPI001EE946D9|nr:hypothetical protein [Micromonospora alfalfae]MCG5464263.1 hypothetical protein [Micromonospora alfalfae]
MTERVDPAAYRAAYNALSPLIPLAQVRGDIAERVSRSLVRQRSMYGLDHMLSLHQSESTRQALVAEIRAELPEGWTSAHPKFIDSAVAAAAKALWDGTEHVAVVTHDDHGRLTPESTVTVAGRTVPVPTTRRPLGWPGQWAERVNAALAQLGYRMAGARTPATPCPGGWPAARSPRTGTHRAPPSHRRR